ncbi:uncharacterized protein EV154DRAFT_511673 [Mucor mucedo]|uniref:uncharacterized protein n=1 Tax=Mucor mucedo TaxID=29922 RepID=UPI00221FAC08|nr:uncharacterized protein EV154DRAFT_511673 [Mucor mucedo]KAI7890304.1 hypothetical protein EV154DRAFT_511673 [Mucor mucedo]
MMTQDQLLVLSFSKSNSSVLIEQFLKEALQILKHADILLSNNTIQDEADVDTEKDTDTVTWRLNLTPTMMTLDTSILTVSGLEKVLELIRINVKPQPPKIRHKKRVNSDMFDISLFRYMIEPITKLSTLTTIPRMDGLNQYNSAQLMRHCVQSFIDCGYAYFLDVPSLVANTEMILSQPSAAKEHTVETLLIFSICTLMIRHTTIHHRGDLNVANSLMHTYYSKARQLLQELFDMHHIAIVQSLFILSLFPQGHVHLYSPSRVKSPLLTMAIRMALAMDLHRLDIQHDKESDQKEKLRRLAWMLLCADYYADWNSTGKTGMIGVTDWHVNFPQAILPAEQNISRKVEYFSNYCRIILIRKMELLKSSYMISLLSPKALRSGLDEQLFQTYFNTPETFKLNLDNANQTWSKNTDLESLLLHELYCHSQLFAQLPFLPKRYFEEFVKHHDSSQTADLNDIYQRITQSSIPFTRTKATPTSKQIFLTEQDLELEFYCLVGCLSIVNHYTQILEALTSIDTIGCHHSPVYGAMITIYVYLMIDKSCQYPEIKSICQINLLRTQRILRQARSIYADPTILLLERVLTRNHVAPKDETPICTLNKRTLEIIRSLQAKSSYLHHHYDDDDVKSE